MLKVWGRRSSFNLQKVMWLVGELGLCAPGSHPKTAPAHMREDRSSRVPSRPFAAACRMAAFAPEIGHRGITAEPPNMPGRRS